MTGSDSTVSGQLRSVAATSEIDLVGRPISAAVVTCLAVVAAVGTGHYVERTQSYLSIQYALPTYDGSVGPLFYVLGGLLLALAALSAVIDAGLLPTVTLAGAPVLGWAVTHFSSSITPHYAITFPLEMAILYGGVFGVTGYLAGTIARRVLRAPA